MRLFVLAASLALLTACSAVPKPPANAAQLLGSWQVDLRPTPDAPAYRQPMTITRLEGRRIDGSFYGTPFTGGLVNTDWGVVHLAFTTRDGSGEYHHSATLREGRLEGLTHSTGRGFLAVWRADKS